MSEYIEKEVGIVSPVPVGAWSNATAYKVLNIVNNGGSTYIAKLANQGIEPGVASNWQTYWMLLAERGVGIQSTSIDEETGNLIITYTDGVVVDAGNVVPVEEFAELKHEMEQAISDAETATGSANDAATLAETKAGLADGAATLATEKAGLADDAATLANQKAQLASQAAELADTKAALADQKATLAQEAAEDAQAKAILAEDAATNANQAAEEARSIAPSKLDKQSYESTRKQAYTKDKDGQQSMTDLDTGSNAATIPVRDENGTFHVGTATQSTHPAQKGYVDAQDALNEKTANKVNIIDDNSTDEQYPSAKAVNNKIKALPVPMQYKGTLGVGGTIQTLPEAAEDNNGFEYKVITDGTYAGQTAHVGDVFISNGTSWDLIPSGDEPSGTVTNVNIEGDGGIETTGGPITTSGTIKVKNTGVRGVTTGATDGTIKVNTNGTETEVPVAGLQSGAFINADTKVDKVSVPTEEDQVYAKDASGTQKMINVPDITAEVEAEIEGIKEGTTIVGHSKVSDNLTPYSEDSGTTQENPFISQGTGTDNNSVIVTTGTIARQLEKQGNTVVKNQLVNPASLNDIETTNDVVFTKSDDKYTLSGTASAWTRVAFATASSAMQITGHKYLIMGASDKVTIRFNGVSGNIDVTSPYAVYTGDSSNYAERPMQFIIQANTNCAGVVIKPKIIDLTQWGFSSDIITDLTSHPGHFSWYYNGSLAYDAGSLQNCNGRYLECGQGRQLWDEVATNSGYILDNGNIANNYGSRIASTNYIVVIPNIQYAIRVSYAVSTYGLRIAWYDKDKNKISVADYYTTISGLYSVGLVTAPTNARFMRFNVESTGYNSSTYKNDISVSLYYTPEQGGEGYDQYYPYVAPIRIDTGNETLKAFDKKLPSGVITGATIEYTFTGNEAGTPFGPNSFYVKTGINKQLRNKVKSAEFAQATYAGLSNGSEIGVCVVNGNPGLGFIAFRDPSKFTTLDEMLTYLTGKTIQIQCTAAYETTEQGTPFSEYAQINDYSYMAWFDSDGNLVSIPQGCKLFYPVDYKGFVDDLVMYTNGDATALAKLDDIDDTALNARGYYKLQDLLTAFGANGMVGGTLRNQLAIAKELDFRNTACLDFGSLTWHYDTYYPRFYATLPADVKHDAQYMPNAICTKYRNAAGGGHNFFIYTDGKIYVYDSDFTDIASFVNDTKGVLLAYEKAST